MALTVSIVLTNNVGLGLNTFSSSYSGSGFTEGFNLFSAVELFKLIWDGSKFCCLCLSCRLIRICFITASSWKTIKGQCSVNQ